MTSLSSRSVLLSLISLLLAASVHAQIQVQVKLPRRHYISGESVVAQVEITNNTGQKLELKSTNKDSWLRLNIRDDQGRIIIPFVTGVFRPADVPNGRTISRKINLSSQYNLRTLGRFSVQASVIPYLTGSQSFNSQQSFFEIVTGRLLDQQRIGLNGKPSELREFRVISHSHNRTTRVFSQVYDVNRRLIIHTQLLGSSLMFQKPQARLDKNNHYHILFQNNPKFFTHVTVAPTGLVLSRDLFKRAGNRPPALSFNPKEEIYVAGGLKFDKEAEKERKLRIHKLSDRPKIVY